MSVPMGLVGGSGRLASGAGVAGVCVRVLTQSDPVASGAAACQAPLSMEFSRQGNWSGLPFLSPDGKKSIRNEGQ